METSNWIVHCMISVCTWQAGCKHAARTDKKQPSSYSYRICLFFFDKFVECLVLFLRTRKLTWESINHKQAIGDDDIVDIVSKSLFSPLDRDKSHLCAYMIPNWSFESPVALISPDLPLLPRTHLNPSTCALTMQSCHYRKTTKEASCFLHSPWHDTALIIYPSIENCPFFLFFFLSNKKKKKKNKQTNSELSHLHGNTYK